MTVRSAEWTRRFETTPDLFGLSGGDEIAPPPVAQAAISDAVRHPHLRPVDAAREKQHRARSSSSADLTLSGTYDRPLLFGRAEIERGELFFEGNRYLVTRGIDRLCEPDANRAVLRHRGRNARARSRPDISRDGRASRARRSHVDELELKSDPPLPTIDIISLLFGQATDPLSIRPRACAPCSLATQSEQELLKVLLARQLAGGITGPVGRAVEQTFGVDTVQITPLIGDSDLQSLNAAARLTIGKRVSSRVFSPFRARSGSRSPTRSSSSSTTTAIACRGSSPANEDGTFAIDFRVRTTF